LANLYPTKINIVANVANGILFKITGTAAHTNKKVHRE
jgi:hypothetical protein